MFMYNPLRKDWFYSYLEIPEEDLIRKELLAIRASNVARTQNNPLYSNIMAPDLLRRCPTVARYLERVGLAGVLHRCLFSQNKGVANGPLTAHVDSFDPTMCEVSLNIPLAECDGSYTAWYDTSDPDLITGSVSPEFTGARVWAKAKLGTITEIRRVEVTQPMLVNPTILHSAITDNPARIISGFRFTRRLTDDEVRGLGIKNPYVQE